MPRVSTCVLIQSQSAAVAAQPISRVAPIVDPSVHQSPETLGVVTHFDVRRFVLDHIVEDGFGSKHQPPIEADRATGRAAAPARSLVTDRYARVTRAIAR